MKVDPERFGELKQSQSRHPFLNDRSSHALRKPLIHPPRGRFGKLALFCMAMFHGQFA
jgi:hypothetical protein